MSTRLRAASGLLAGAALVAMSVVTGPTDAFAESYTARCYSADQGTECYGRPPATSGLDLAARARYTDETDRLCAADTQKDGRSAVAVYWPDGQPDRKARVWNRNGKGSSVCRGLGGLRENARYRIQVCLGEWAPRPRDRRIIACGPSTAVLL